MNEKFSAQTVSALIGETKAFINSKCEVDSGKITEATVDETGAIVKVVIQGDKKATITMGQVFETVPGALAAAILIKERQVLELKNDIAAMLGRVQNISKIGE